MTVEGGRRAARIELGGIEEVKEHVRDARTGALLEQCLQDLQYGGRVVRRSPGFTCVVVLTLALGMPARRATRVDPLITLRTE